MCSFPTQPQRPQSRGIKPQIRVSDCRTPRPFRPDNSTQTAAPSSHRYTTQVMYPADAMKTLAQVRGSTNVGLALLKIPPSVLLKGSVTTSLMAVPAGAIQFSVFGTIKKYGARNLPPWFSIAVIEMVGAGLGALLSCLVQTPQEIIKQRLQAGIYPSFVEGFSTLHKDEGLAGFYTAFGPTVARNMPMVVFTFTVFARLKDLYTRQRGRQPSGMANMVLGFSAAAVGTLLTQPVDVIKTRLMTQTPSDVEPYKGVLDCVIRVAQEEGLAVFGRGLVRTKAFKQQSDVIWLLFVIILIYPIGRFRGCSM
mmetsp:Transcript_2691/g.4318  ORF Transcript_2691/g.4318 Transcript_2691/m.4318 type:complete len:309 (+) Transcript_2691:53-979(+)